MRKDSKESSFDNYVKGIRADMRYATVCKHPTTVLRPSKTILHDVKTYLKANNYVFIEKKGSLLVKTSDEFKQYSLMDIHFAGHLLWIAMGTSVAVCMLTIPLTSALSTMLTVSLVVEFNNYIKRRRYYREFMELVKLSKSRRIS